MKHENLKDLMNEAKEIVKGYEEPYKSIGFRFMLEKLFDMGRKEEVKVIAREKSLVELIKEQNPQTHPNRVMVMAYYLFKFKEMHSFNVTDISKCYMNAHTEKPKNLSDMININIRKGFLMKAPEKKDNLHAYITTMTGEAYVENGLKETSK